MNNEQKFLVESIIDDVARYIVEDEDVTILDALNTVYNSQLYEKLMDLGTGIYYQSPAYCYELLKHELKYGKTI
jgi:hypothetical protein